MEKIMTTEGKVRVEFVVRLKNRNNEDEVGEKLLGLAEKNGVLNLDVAPMLPGPLFMYCQTSVESMKKLFGGEYKFDNGGNCWYAIVEPSVPEELRTLIEYIEVGARAETCCSY